MPTYPTIIDVAKSMHNNELLNLVQALTRASDTAVLGDMPYFEATDHDSHAVSRVTSEPSGTWTAVNEGVPFESGTTAQDVEPIAMLESMNKVEKKLLDKYGTPEKKTKYRSQRDMMHLNGMSKTHADCLFYGARATNPKKYNGLSTRMASLTTAGPYVIDNGGTANLTSIYAVDWGFGKTYGVYPKDDPYLGIEMTDRGMMKLLDSGGTNYANYFVTDFLIKTGLVVEDLRCIGRLANINSTNGGTGDLETDKLIELLSYFEDTSTVVLYAGRALLQQIDIQAKDKTNVVWGSSEIFGRPVRTFQGVPIRKCNRITITETQVS